MEEQYTVIPSDGQWMVVNAYVFEGEEEDAGAQAFQVIGWDVTDPDEPRAILSGGRTSVLNQPKATIPADDLGDAEVNVAWHPSEGQTLEAAKEKAVKAVVNKMKSERRRRDELDAKRQATAS
jgi:hypothetical protein